MKRRRSLLHKSSLVAAFSLLSAACGSPGAENETSEPASTSETLSLAVLHEFDVQGSQYRFLDASLDGNPSVILQQTAPVDGSVPPLTQLHQAYPGLTQLETYLALVPDGEPPAQPLVDSHPIEAAALGREDDAVRSVDFEPSVLVDKSLATCKTFVSQHLAVVWGGAGIVHGEAATQVYSEVRAVRRQ